MNRADGPIHAYPEPAIRASGATQSLAPPPPNDPVAFAEAAIGGLLGLVALSPHAKRRLGLSGASRRADGWPAWYLWLAGTNGAYELALLPTADTESDSGAGAEFTLRYFPHPDEDDFAAFADVEREARTSAQFDRTGTPAIESLADLDPSLFHIAALSLVPCREDGRIGLVLQTQDVWMETTEDGGEARVRRQVPGLALAAPLVDFLVCGRTYHGRHPPASFWLAREPGTAWHIDATGARPIAADTALYTLCVDGLPGLSVPDMLCVGGHAIEPPPADAIVGRHDGDAMPDRCEPFATNDWWRAARWTFYPVGAMCGCLGDETAVVGRDDEEAVPRRRR
jgi:hypothetical protein